MAEPLPAASRRQPANVPHLPKGGAAPAGGIFLTTYLTRRIARHFARLQRETRGIVDWSLVHNPGNGASPANVTLDPAPEQLLPIRHSRMLENGGLAPGYVDVLTVPLAMAQPYQHTWLVEFDVDFSGKWSDFFTQFAANDADFLTTTLMPLGQLQDWFYADGVGAPPGVQADAHLRFFPPVTRMSKRFLSIYVEEAADPRWVGHHEYVMPTIARHRGLIVEDIGGSGPLCPPQRRGTLYSNTPQYTMGGQGTFLWRPARERYFHERPSRFSEPNFLYHPVKPKPRTPLGNAVADLRDVVARGWHRVSGKKGAAS